MCVKKIIAAALLIAVAAVAGLNIGADPSECRSVMESKEYKIELARRGAL